MKKYRLSFESEEGMAAMAIAASEKDYRICFQLNKLLHIDMGLTGSLGIEVPARGLVSIPAFYYAAEDGLHEYYLIQNRQADFYVFPKMKQFDFIFILKPEPEPSALEGFRKSISGISNIQSTFVIPGEQLKHIHSGE